MLLIGTPEQLTKNKLSKKSNESSLANSVTLGNGVNSVFFQILKKKKVEAIGDGTHRNRLTVGRGPSSGGTASVGRHRSTLDGS